MVGWTLCVEVHMAPHRCTPLWSRWIGLLLGLVLLLGPIDTMAARYTSPAFNDLVFALDLPDGWSRSSSRFSEFEFYASFAAVTEEGSRSQAPTASIYVYDRRIKPLTALTWEGMVEYARGSTYFSGGQKEWGESETTVAGERAFHRLLSGVNYYDAEKDEQIAASGAVSRRVVFTTLGGMLEVRLHVDAPTPAAFPEVDRAFATMLASLAIHAVDQLPADMPLWEAWETPQVLISRRRDYELTAWLRLEIPPNWVRGEPSMRPADVSLEQGSLGVVMEHPRQGDEPFGPLPVLMLQGMPVTVHTKAAYLDTADAWRQRVAPDVELLSTEEIRHSGNFTLARAAPRHGESTRGTIVRTFAGRDAEGNDVKMRMWIAGGLTMVAFYTYMAPAHLFEEHLADAERAVDSIDLTIYPTPSSL